jgi:hypothetical protein
MVRSKSIINRKIKSTNTSGVTGVRWYGASNKWRAFISVNKKEKWLGGFKNFEEAVEVRKRAEKRYYGKFTPLL